MTATKLSIYTDETVTSGDRKLFEVIAERARNAHLAGVTVLQPKPGFGQSAHVRRGPIPGTERSVMIEIIDEEDRLRAFMTGLREVGTVGFMTLERIEVIAPTEDVER